MRRSVFALFFTCALVSVSALTGTAKAREYYDDFSCRNQYSNNVWYSSNCCYRKVVRHSRSTRYERVDRQRRYERYGYYDRGYRSRYDYNRPYRYEESYYTTRRYDDFSSYAGSSEVCYSRRVKVEDGGGGWVWGSTRVCD